MFFKKNFWENLKKTKFKKKNIFFVLAPMHDITDKPFRELISKIGSPDVFFTEFVSIDGLCSKEGQERLLLMLGKTKYEKKYSNLVFQIFGRDVEKFSKAINLIKKLKPAGIDINMGCPDKTIIRQGSGSALIKKENRPLVEEILKIAKKQSGDIPISIKTRIGFKKVDLKWIEFLLSLKIDVLTIHLRTQKEMSEVPAHWELAKKIDELRKKISPKTILIGNGDIENMKEGGIKAKESGFDGIMIGRGILKNIFLFKDQDFYNLSIKERFKFFFIHLDLFEKEFYKNKEWIKSPAIMKKFFKIYINNFNGSKNLRIKLMSTNNFKEIKKISLEFLKNNKSII